MNNREKSPNSITFWCYSGTFSILLKLNRYFRAILQGIHQSVIVVNGNVVDHSVPDLFGKVDGEHFKKLLLKLFSGKVGGSAFDGVMELIDALP